MLDRYSESQLDRIYSALSNSTRREILRLLKGGPHYVTEIVEFSLLSQSTVSRHLAVLTNAGLVARRRCGQRVFYWRIFELLSRFMPDPRPIERVRKKDRLKPVPQRGRGSSSAAPRLS